MPRQKVLQKCVINNCDRFVKAKGWCSKHYQQFYKESDDYKSIIFGENLRDHPLYVIWWQRKSDKLLCKIWLDFRTFIKDVSPKPEGEYFLVRLRDELFGPDNFKWQEHLKRKDGESKKDWWSRKRAARIAANPSMESDRNIKRKYGLTRQEYDEMLVAQNYGCAICGEKETSVDARTSTIKCLAVDHCHNTDKIRGLLCWRCNGTIGKLEDNLELLDKMKYYLTKHKDN